MPNPEFEREVPYIGGPWDGQTRWEPKAFWPPTNQMPNGERGLIGAWPDVWPTDEPRYMPEIVSGPDGCTVRMVWAAPNDPHAPALIERPPSLKDYSDYGEDDAWPPRPPTPPSPPLAEPGRRDWDPTPAEAADDDLRYWVDRYDSGEPDEPSDHFNY